MCMVGGASPSREPVAFVAGANRSFLSTEGAALR